MESAHGDLDPTAEPLFETSGGGLLARFAERRDEAAFAELVRRHGAVVFGLCRRRLSMPAAGGRNGSRLRPHERRRAVCYCGFEIATTP